MGKTQTITFLKIKKKKQELAEYLPLVCKGLMPSPASPALYKHGGMYVPLIPDLWKVQTGVK